jgi:hypothetical protein
MRWQHSGVDLLRLTQATTNLPACSPLAVKRHFTCHLNVSQQANADVNVAARDDVSLTLQPAANSPDDLPPACIVTVAIHRLFNHIPRHNVSHPEVVEQLPNPVDRCTMSFFKSRHNDSFPKK